MAIEALQYVYELSDFETTGGNITPPDEDSAVADAPLPINVTLSPGSTFQQIEVNDLSNDGFDEINSTDQTLNAPITLGGTDYDIGDRIFVNYVLTDANGFQLMSITIGTGNTGRNDTTAVITNGPMVPGQQYTFISNVNVRTGEVPYEDLACFVSGTHIQTPNGPVPVQNLQAGDLITTAEGGPKPIVAVLCKHISARQLERQPQLKPVRISAHALSHNHPALDLLVSRQHRMLVSSKIAERMFGVQDVLIPAIKLTSLEGIEVEHGTSGIVYFHLVMENHEVVFAEGAPSESLYLGNGALKSMPAAGLVELMTLFPELAAGQYRPSARPIPSGSRAKRLMARHAKNNVPALQLYA